jgi:hypothetical protein
MALLSDLRRVDGQLRETGKKARYHGPGQRNHPDEAARLIQIVPAQMAGTGSCRVHGEPVSRLVAVLRAGQFKEPGGRSSPAAPGCGLVPAVQPGGVRAVCR